MDTEIETTATVKDKQFAAHQTDVIQSNTVPQQGTSSNQQHHYSYAHYWPPQQQYKLKSWTIAIILKLTFVAWDSWTYRIGY